MVAAASIARLFINQSRSVGLMMFGEKLEVIEPDRGTQHFGRMLEALAVAQPNGTVPVATLLYQQSRRWGRHTTVCVVTGSTDPRWQGAIRSLTQRGVKSAVALLDLASWGGRSGAAATAAELQALGVQVNLVRQGDHLAAALVGSAPGQEGGIGSGINGGLPVAADASSNGAASADDGGIAELEEAEAETAGVAR